MTIYLFDNSCISMIDYIQEKVRIDIDKTYKIVPDKNLELLMNKELFLIDVFNTFIQPVVDYYDEGIILERSGMVEFMKLRNPREGFFEFLEYYHNSGKKIGIHSDAIYEKEFNIIRKMWKFDKYMDKFFSSMYVKKANLFDGFDERNYVKDFDKMILEFNISKEKTLIIGDGGSDILPARAFNVDLLLVPTFNTNPKFDYRRLMPKYV
ncbi:MAG: HAD family hydrolase [Candidatus Woesearchaeota archaeon]